MASHEIDLHGQTWSEALAAFIEFYNDEVLRAGGGEAGRLNVIHGYGATGVGGVLRTRIRAFLQRHEDRLEFIPGEKVDGNQGHTIVVPMEPLPGTEDLLAEQVWAYCERARSRSKIIGKFRRYGAPMVIQAIRALERQQRLRALVKGRIKLYEVV
jgi:hypothetical protein